MIIDRRVYIDISWSDDPDFWREYCDVSAHDAVEALTNLQTLAENEARKAAGSVAVTFRIRADG